VHGSCACAVLVMQAKYAHTHTRLAELKVEVVEGKRKMSAAQERVSEATVEVDSAASAFAKAAAEFSAAEKEDIALRESLAHAIRTFKKAEETIAKESNAGAEAKALVVRTPKGGGNGHRHAGALSVACFHSPPPDPQDRTAAALPELEAAVERLTAAKAEEEEAYDATLTGLKGETEALRLQLDAKQAEMKPHAEAMAELNGQISVSRTAATLVRQRMEAGSKELSALKAQVSAQPLQRRTSRCSCHMLIPSPGERRPPRRRVRRPPRLRSWRRRGRSRPRRWPARRPWRATSPSSRCSRRRRPRHCVRPGRR